jgi:hypothetical protein
MTLKNILIVLAIILIAFAVTYYQDSRFREKETLNEKHQNELVSRNLILQKELRTSERERVVLGNHIDSINRINTALIRLTTKLDSAYNNVKGSYSKRTVTELEAEMIIRYNANK